MVSNHNNGFLYFIESKYDKIGKTEIKGASEWNY